MMQEKVTALYNRMFSDRRPPWLRNIIDSYLHLDWEGMQLEARSKLYGRLYLQGDIDRVRAVLHLHWLFEQEVEMAYKEGFCR